MTASDSATSPCVAPRLPERLDGMKRLAATNVVAQGPHKQTNAVKSRKWRPAVEHIGMDVHKRKASCAS